ncbi:MAG: 4-hydroxybenzoate octaprenyltransferase [Gammaproteobacteria bacterium]|nr:4-hydroxybenzoate octaprenyltransferase [Gammaproteobacteria bacterium]
MLKKLLPYLYLMRLHRPIGIFLLLWPTLWALWLAAAGHPSLKHVLIFTLGVIIMRSAGCIINDIADRHLDGQVRRTQSRPLATQQISVSSALFLFLFLCCLAFGLVLFLNTYTLILSLVAFVLAVVYPFTKRFTYFPQVVLGAAFAWAIPMVFAASNDNIPLAAWLIYFAALVWPVAYDTFYAMADKEDDLSAGIRSTAILFGNNVKIMVLLIYGIFFTSLWGIGLLYTLQPLYFGSLILAILVTLYQFWLIRTEKPQAYFRAFLNNNWIGLLIFLGILANYTPCT